MTSKPHVSQYTIRLADGVPMAFPADHTLDDIRTIAQICANGEHGSMRGPVVILRNRVPIGTVKPENPSRFMPEED